MKNNLFESYSESYKNPLKIVKSEINYRKANKNDVHAIAKIIAQRNSKPFENFIDKIEDEIQLNKNKLFVAQYRDEVVAFARVAKFENLKEYNLPNGYYLMGVIVKNKFRRLNIGTNLINERLNYINSVSNRAYFIVNSINRVSIEFHEKLGFKLLQSDITFPNVSFSNGGIGLLYVKEL